MFLSNQTYDGIYTTVKGYIGAARFLLSHSVPYVFSNIFCLDPIEEHFGRHRGLGNRSRNPSVYEFGHQNKLRIQRSLAFKFQPKGNTAGRAAGDNRIDEIDEGPLPKIKRH
ncbi:uncharacterized protein LOC141904326 [Tubulanus polymorphus]|uniref:uncharacterized protein LOC141904326 n=1 Tax=Tubulanus polymorphus TaxID=672921 RepID=UPI003DA5D565